MVDVSGKLYEIYEKELKVLNRLVNVNLSKRDALIELNTDKLKDLTNKEENLTSDLEKLEAEKKEFVNEMKSKMNIEGLANLVDLIASERKKTLFKCLVQDVKNTYNKLVKLVSLNLCLIEQAMKVSNFMRRVIVENQKKVTYTNPRLHSRENYGNI